VTTPAEQFVALYQHARVEDQLSYYERRARQLQAAYRQVLLTSAVLFGASAAIGLIAGLDVPGKLVWAIFAATLPAITTVLSAYESLYGFERTSKVFGDAARNLRRVRPPTLADAADERAAVQAYVAEVEQILENELGQWGQLAAESSVEAERR
jgi:hypothetical protein